MSGSPKKVKTVKQSEEAIPTSDQQHFVASIDGANAKTLKEFYAAIGAALDFPDYFGENLDALEDCVNDLSWIEQDKTILLIFNFSALLQLAAQKKKSIVLDILNESPIELLKVV